MNEFKPNCAIRSPADHLRECLEARGMTSADLARATGLNSGRIAEILHRKRKITPKIAVALEKAFKGESYANAELWLALQSSWDLMELRAKCKYLLDSAQGAV